MSSVGARTGGCRRWFRAVPPGKSSGRLRQKLSPACTSRTPCSTFSGVSKLMRPSSSSSPQSPHVEPGGRSFHRFVTASSLRCLYRPVGLASEPMTEKEFVVSADGHVVEPTDLFRTRLPKHLRDRGFWEEDFEIEPLVEGGVRDFARVRTPGFEGWAVSRYRHFDGTAHTGDPDRMIEDMDLDGID